MSGSAILWRGLVLAGHEHARLAQHGSGWFLEGVAAISHEGTPCRLDYRIRCSDAWITQSAEVFGWIGERRVDVSISASADRRWLRNGIECPQVEGCTDIDLNFSPSTNTLPIRRLGLAVGERQTVRAAWLRFPSLELELLEQSYARLTEDRYRYESAGGFAAELRVDGAGFVRDYPGIWIAEELGG